MPPTNPATALAPTIEVAPKDHWSDDERRNVELIADFVHLAMNTHDFALTRERYGASRYLQHSRGIPDGVEGLVGYLENLVGRYPGYSYDVKHIHADGEYVTFQSHATLKESHRGNDRKGLNIIDTWRVVDGRIAEHWDAIQPLDVQMRLFGLLLGGRARNANPIF